MSLRRTGVVALSLVWLGWAIWCLVILLLGLRHPPVLDEAQPIDDRRLAIALLLLVIFVLSFAPLPLAAVTVAS